MPFDEANIRSRLESLRNQDRVEVALSCAEGLFPAYERFFQETGQGDPKQLGDAIEVLKDALQGDVVSRDRLTRAVEVCMSLVPDDHDESWTTWSGLAQNAAAAAFYALRSYLSGEAQDVIWALLQCEEAAHYAAEEGLPIGVPAPEDLVRKL
jgi:uncharacterized protein YjaG (DUF416 family)